MLKWSHTGLELSMSSLLWNRYRMIRDPAGWLSVNQENGIIKVKSKMDRESAFVKDNKYTALIGAYDDGRSRSGRRLCGPPPTRTK